jgi:Xaa-Pro aminopeptidase
MRYHDAITVALTRDAQRPLALVTGEFTWYYLMSDARYRYSLEVFLCGAPPDPERAASEWQGGIKNDLRSRVFPDAGLAPVSDREQQRARNVERAVRAHELALDRERALGRALGWLELRGARIATDSAAGRAWTERNGAHLTFVEADPLLTRARLIKSAREAVLARTAATANVEAALASVAAVRRGASLDDFRRHIFSEAARRGNRGVFMVVDDVSEEGGSDTLREGKAFMFDAVSAGAGAARQSG